MEDESGRTVACSVSHEALRDHDRMHSSGTDGAVFDAYRELIEAVASDAHDAEGPFGAHGRILVPPRRLRGNAERLEVFRKEKTLAEDAYQLTLAW
jgi:hypothetical protein